MKIEDLLKDGAAVQGGNYLIFNPENKIGASIFQNPESINALTEQGATLTPVQNIALKLFSKGKELDEQEFATLLENYSKAINRMTPGEDGKPKIYLNRPSDEVRKILDDVIHHAHRANAELASATMGDFEEKDVEKQEAALKGEFGVLKKAINDVIEIIGPQETIQKSAIDTNEPQIEK